jgi:hypothetical protein
MFEWRGSVSFEDGEAVSPGRKWGLILVVGILLASWSIKLPAQSNSEPETTIHYRWKLKVNLKKADFLDASTFQYPDLFLRINAFLPELELETIDGYIGFAWDASQMGKRRYVLYGDGVGRQKGNPSEFVFYRVYSRNIHFTKSRKVLRLRIIEMHI